MFSSAFMADMVFDDCISSEEMVHRYNTCLIKLLDQHAPLVTKKVPSRRRLPWYNREISQLKCQQRKLERQWRQTRLTVHRQ